MSLTFLSFPLIEFSRYKGEPRQPAEQTNHPYPHRPDSVAPSRSYEYAVCTASLHPVLQRQGIRERREILGGRQVFGTFGTNFLSCES